MLKNTSLVWKAPLRLRTEMRNCWVFRAQLIRSWNERVSCPACGTSNERHGNTARLTALVSVSHWDAYLSLMQLDGCALTNYKVFEQIKSSTDVPECSTTTPLVSCGGVKMLSTTHHGMRSPLCLWKTFPFINALTVLHSDCLASVSVVAA